MGELGLLSVNEKRIVKKGQMHKYYKINPGIFLLPSHTKDKVHDTGILKKIFKDGIKFASIGIAAGVSWILTKNSTFTDDDNMWSSPYTTDNSTTIPLIVVIIGLSVVYFLGKKKKKV